MSTQPAGELEAGAGGLPDVVPFEVPSLSRLSSELGSRVVSTEEASLAGEWAYDGSRWRLSVFDVTSNTVVLRVTTPVGRRRFYGAARMDFESARPVLEESLQWMAVSPDGPQ